MVRSRRRQGNARRTGSGRFRRVRLEQLSREISQKQKRREASQASITATEQKLAQLYESSERAKEEIERNEVDYQAIDSLLADSDSKISQIRTQREKTLEKFLGKRSRR